MTEAPVTKEESTTWPTETTRQLIVTKGRSGPIIEPFYEVVVRNQAQFGRNTDDYAAMVKAHQNITREGFSSITDRVLGVREETRRTLTTLIDGKLVKFVEAEPYVRNIWVGEHVKLFTQNEAINTQYSGKSAPDFGHL